MVGYIGHKSEYDLGGINYLQDSKDSIVRNGLVVYLDAANKNSYPGSGTTWTDLSNNNNNGALTNSPSFSGDSDGSFFFDGIDDYASISYNSSSMDFSAAQTICIWIKPANGSEAARRNPYNQAYGGSGTLTYETNKTINYFFGTNGGNSTPYVGRNSTFTIENNEIAFISVTRNQSTNSCKWYKNGELQASYDAGGYASTNNGSFPIIIGDGYTNHFLGNIYLVFVYNKELTEKEIQQNFNATRERYLI
jgi:hypothetical protein